MSVKYKLSAIVAIEQLVDYLVKYPDTFLKAIGNPDEVLFVGLNFVPDSRGNLNRWIGTPPKNGVPQNNQIETSS